MSKIERLETMQFLKEKVEKDYEELLELFNK